ncbi:heme-binding protein [Actinomycetospora sp. NBC_00405]|uniref:heme-binding protein n=1 Tax=Actinomycetospora sp. NBC_00405 TaxID=2975952 RepID=UPI002E204C0E
MPEDARLERFRTHERVFALAEPGDADLGPLGDLPGKWKSNDRGWNMIALPFAKSATNPIGYRLLLNQYKEILNFSLVDKAVPNRGVDTPAAAVQTDQRVVTLDYEQLIKQIAVADRPQSTVAGSIDPPAPIHHEPGLFLNMANLTDGGPDVARLATIPHGNSALALGTSSTIAGGPTIPRVNGLPLGVGQNVDTNPYLEPYKFFRDNPFEGLFDPTSPHALLEQANVGLDITSTTVLDLSTETETETGGISNIPFIVKQADAVSMKSTFWIQQLADGSKRMQYLQVVMLDFFPRFDGLPGLIGWPHVSINTLDKISDQPDFNPDPDF